MEYAWGFAASRRPFPGEIAASSRSRATPSQALFLPKKNKNKNQQPQLRASNEEGEMDPSEHEYCTCNKGEHEGEKADNVPRSADAASASPPKEGEGRGEEGEGQGSDQVVSTYPAPPDGVSRVRPPLPKVPGPGPDPEPASPAALVGGPASASAAASCLPSSGSPSNSTPVCASCNKPPADTGSLLSASTTTTTTNTTTAAVSSSSSSFFHHPQNQAQAGDEQRRSQRLENHHQHHPRRQSHPDPARDPRQLLIPHPYPHSGAPLTPVYSVREYRAIRRAQRSNRLSAPTALPTLTPTLTSTSTSTTTTAFPSASGSLDRERLRSPRQQHNAMAGDSTLRSQSVSATTTSLSNRTVNDLASASRDDDDASTRSRQGSPRKPFVTKSNGRTYLSDETLPYPLPVDLHELHRQSLRTLLLFQLFGGPVCSPALVKHPPTRVLDLACGYGFWSMMCHSYFSRKGYSNISFTGLDIAPLGGIAGVPGPGSAVPPTMLKDRGSASSATGNWAEQPPDKKMKWEFVQHDMRILPLPFPDDEFDLVMCKELSLVNKLTQFQDLMDEFQRILKPGGVLEAWDCDHPIRMLRPHVPDTPTTTTGPKAFEHEPGSSTNNNGSDSSNGGGSKKNEQENQVTELGAYFLGNNTPLSGPQNNYLIEYNSWINKYLESQQLLSWPCANIGSYFLQEPLLTGFGFKRLAIPLTEVRWEREGVGGVVTKDGKSYVDTGKAVGRATSKAHSGDNCDGDKKGRILGSAQLALRQTALQTVLGFIEGMEPSLRKVSGKKQDEWDTWMGKLMKELVENDGANWGECLEVGAWWAMKMKDPPA